MGGYIIYGRVLVVGPVQHNSRLPKLWPGTQWEAQCCYVTGFVCNICSKQVCPGHGRLGSEIPGVIFFTHTVTMVAPLSHARPAIQHLFDCVVTVESVEHKKLYWQSHNLSHLWGNTLMHPSSGHNKQTGLFSMIKRAFKEFSFVLQPQIRVFLLHLWAKTNIIQ